MMRFLKIAVLAFLYFLPTLGIGRDNLEELKVRLQTATDTTLVKVLYRLSEETVGIDVNESIAYGQKSFALAKELDFLPGISASSFRLSSAYRYAGQYENALSWAEISLAASLKNNDLYHQGAIYNEMAIIYSKLSDYENSLTYYLKAIDVFDRIGEWDTTAKIKLNMGYLYRSMGDISASKKSCMEALNAFEDHHDELGSVGPCTCLGDAYFSLDIIDSAIQYYGRSLMILDQYNEPHKLISPLANMAMIYTERGNYDLALSMTMRALEISESLGYVQNAATCYQNIGEIYLAQQKLDSAKVYFEKSGEIFRQSGALNEIMGNYSAISEYFHSAGKDDIAYDYLLKYIEIKDSLYNETKTQQILEIQESYNTEKRLQKIKQLETEKKMDIAQIVLRNTLLIASLLLFVALIIITLLYVKRLRSKQKTHKIELEQKVLRAQMNPHFIFNSLNSIQRMYIDGNLESANDYLSDFGSLLRKILDNSGQTYITIKEELATLELYLEMEKVRTSQKMNYIIHVAEEIDIHYLKIPPLIIQPLVENAIWHGILPNGEAGIIQIELKAHTKNAILCTVTDNGVGMADSLKNKQTSHQSKGMKITRDRLGIENAMHIENVKSGGTKVSILIPTFHD